MKPVIGIVSRTEKNQNNTSLFYIFDDMRRSIIDLGGEVLMLLPVQNIDYYKTRIRDYQDFTLEEEKQIIKWLKMCDGIVLPGGSKMTNYDRYVLDYAIKNNIPILGICLGMQIMSCYNEDIELKEINNSFINHKQETTDGVSHSVKISQNSLLYRILNKEEIMVNSFHTKQIIPNHLYKNVAYAEDGVIEAIEYDKNTFNIGLQWHPERNYKDDINSKLILESFIKSCKEKIKEH